MLSSLSPRDIGTYLEDDPIESDIAILNLLASRGTHWLAYVNQNYFVSCGCFPPQSLFKGNTKRIFNFFSEYKLQGPTSKKSFFCAAH